MQSLFLVATRGHLSNFHFGFLIFLPSSFEARAFLDSHSKLELADQSVERNLLLNLLLDLLSMGDLGAEANPKLSLRLTKTLDREEFRMLGHQMVDFIADYFQHIETFPVQSQVQPGYLKKLLPESAPRKQESFQEVLDDINTKLMPGITHWQSPSFFGYYPANTSTASILGEMLTASLSVLGFSWITSPAATELEIIVLDWLAQLLTLPHHFLSSSEKGGGVIQGSACEALFVVMLAARKQALMQAAMEQGISEAEALAKLTVYTSDQAHCSVDKTSQLAGINATYIRKIPTDASTNYAMSPALLACTIQADRAAGLIPSFLCAVVGSTSAAAVDPLSKLGDIAQEQGLWFHVDGAYAGSACICAEYRPCLEGVEKADSFVINLHKWLLTTCDCSTLWVQDNAMLVGALSTIADYLHNKMSDNNSVVDFKDWQIPLSRRFRSLKLWMVMRMYGTDFPQAYIRNPCDLAKHLESPLGADPRFEVMARRSFSLLCFRLKPPVGDPDNGSTLNGKLVEVLNMSGDILITHTVLAGVYTIRFAIAGARTELRHVDAAWKLIQQQASKLLSQAP